jgi:phage shock protein A
MHIRMSRYSLLPGQSVEQLVTRAEELRPQMDVLGARALHAVQMGENEFCSVAIYESKSAADHALEHAKQMWEQFGDVIDLKTMKIDRGDVVWNY